MAGDTVDKGKGGYVLVVERFPEHREVLDRLFESSRSFQSLCDDYEECLSALRYWRESSLAEAPEFRNEFSSLLRALDEEILEHVSRETPD